MAEQLLDEFVVQPPPATAGAAPAPPDSFDWARFTYVNLPGVPGSALAGLWSAYQLPAPAPPPPPPLTPAPPLVPVNPGIPPANDPVFLGLSGSTLAAAGAAVLGILFPQPMGPAEFDEAPTPGAPPEPLDEVLVRSTPLPYPLAPLDPDFETVTTRFPYERPFSVPDFGLGFRPGIPGAYGLPGIGPEPVGLPQPGGQPRPVPRPAPEADVRPAPAPDPFLDPFGNPRAAPEPYAPPRGAPRIPPAPDPFAFPPGTPLDPVLPPLGDPVPRNFRPPVTVPTLDPFLDRFTQPNPEPVPEPERDPCDKKPKKKEKNKRKDRTECWKGTYVQRKRGISYTRREKVPCESSARLPAVARKLGKKLKPGQFPSTALTADQWTDLATDAFKQFYPIIDDYLKRKRKEKEPKKEPKPRKERKQAKKRNRKPKTTVPRLPGTIYTSPF